MISAVASRELPPAHVPGLFLMTNSFETGGSERQFVALAKSLDSRLFHLRVGCIVKRGRLVDGFDEVAEFPVGGNMYGFRSMQARWRLARYLRAQKIAIAHAFDFYTNLLLIPAARMARVPVVIGSCRQLGDLLSPAKYNAELAALRWADRVVCNSSAAADRLRKRGLPETQLITIGNGLDPSAFAAPPYAPPRGPSVLRVGMVARMNTEAKNHRAFLRMAARLSSRFPATEFILAGDGPLRPQLERHAHKLGIHDRVRFLGDCEDTRAVFAGLDVSVLPSVSESLSNSILESMAAGVPVVAARVGGNSELVAGDRGILVALHDEDELANAIERLLRNPILRAELGRNARSFAEENFTIARMSKRHEQLYGELLANKTQRRHLQRSSAWAGGKQSRPLRVAVVAASSRYVGGQSVQAELLIENWRNDPEVDASLIPIDPRLPRVLRWVERIPFVRTLVREPFYLAALWRGLKDTDVAHIFSASYWSFVVAPLPACLIARMRGSKTVVHYHSGEARDHLRRFRTVRRILANADGFVVPSGHLVDVFREFGLRAQSVPNIVDLTKFPFRMRKPLGTRLLCTRGFHPYYAVDVVVRAFALVTQEFPDAELVLVGGGPQEREIRQLVEHLKLAGVRFAGVVSRQRIGEFYEAADIFINASVLDNMPVSILEAFASGTPVVTTAPEGMRYLVEPERTGLLSDPGDASGLAQNVIRLLRDPDLAGLLASNAFERSKCYAWPEVRAQWLEVYRSVTNRGRVQPQDRARAEESGNSLYLTGT